MTISDTWVCPTCGASFPPGPAQPARCPLCEDERQWVPPTGQVWTTMEELTRSGHHTEVARARARPDRDRVQARRRRGGAARSARLDARGEPPVGPAGVHRRGRDRRGARGGRVGGGQLEPSAHVRRDRRVESRVRRGDSDRGGRSALADAPRSRGPGLVGQPRGAARRHARPVRWPFPGQRGRALVRRGQWRRRPVRRRHAVHHPGCRPGVVHLERAQPVAAPRARGPSPPRRALPVRVRAPLRRLVGPDHRRRRQDDRRALGRALHRARPGRRSRPKR